MTWSQIHNQFKSATLLSATHECTLKIWAKHERHSFQNWRVQIERHSFLGVSEVKECTLWKSLKISRIFFALCAKWNIINILLLLTIAIIVFFCTANLNTDQFKHCIQCTLSFFTFLKSQCTYSNQNLILQVKKFKKCKFKDPKV